MKSTDEWYFILPLGIFFNLCHDSLPHFFGRFVGKRHAEQTVRAVDSELRAAFAAAWQDLRAAHTTAKNLRRDALPATQEAYNIVRRAYDEGHLPLIDVLDAQRALVAIRREILDADVAYAVALARAEGLTTTAFPTTTALLSPQ